MDVASIFYNKIKHKRGVSLNLWIAKVLPRNLSTERYGTELFILQIKTHKWLKTLVCCWSRRGIPYHTEVLPVHLCTIYTTRETYCTTLKTLPVHLSRTTGETYCTTLKVLRSHLCTTGTTGGTYRTTLKVLSSD